MTWTLDNGTIVMQNFVDSQKVSFFIKHLEIILRNDVPLFFDLADF